MDKEKVCHDLAISLVNKKFDTTDSLGLGGHELVLKTYVEIYRELMNSYDRVISSVDKDEAKQKEMVNILIRASKDVD